MSIQRILDQLLAAGSDMARQGESAARDYAAKAETYAADRLGVGDDPASRGALLKGAAGGAMAAGALALLLGAKSGRRLAGGAVKLGGLAALGGLAYAAYQRYADKDAAPGAAPIDRLEGPQAENRARAILAAMIAAAKADGHIDENERAAIEGRMKEMSPEDHGFIRAQLEAPVDARAIAAGADNAQGAREIYAISAMVAGGDHPDERVYLDDLAAALKLDPGLARALENDIRRG